MRLADDETLNVYAGFGPPSTWARNEVGRFRRLPFGSNSLKTKWSGREDLNLRPPGPEPDFVRMEIY
jgi:hypothetical protein